MPLLCSNSAKPKFIQWLISPSAAFQPSSPTTLPYSVHQSHTSPLLLNTTKMLSSQDLCTCYSLCSAHLSLLSTCLSPLYAPCSDIILSSLTSLPTSKPLNLAACYPPSLLYFSLKNLSLRIIFNAEQVPNKHLLLMNKQSPISGSKLHVSQDVNRCYFFNSQPNSARCFTPVTQRSFTDVSVQHFLNLFDLKTLLSDQCFLENSRLKRFGGTNQSKREGKNSREKRQRYFQLHAHYSSLTIIPRVLHGS